MIINEILSELIELSNEAYKKNEVPVSCIITLDNKIIIKTHNEVEAKKDKSLHAELIALNKAAQLLGTSNFHNLDLNLYCTLEPCCMCFALLSYYKVKRVYYFLEDEKFGGHGRIFQNKSSFFKPEIYFIESVTVKNLMQKFFSELRHQS